MNFFQKNKINILKVIIVFVFVITSLFLFQNVLAQSGDAFGLDPIGNNIGLGGQDIRLTIAKIIRAVLGLLGIIALVIILYGGYVYMTAGGNEERVATAKKILINGTIGLVIILSSFSIAQFLINQLGKATGALGGNDNPNCLDHEYAVIHPNECYGDDSDPDCMETLKINNTFVLQSITPVTVNTGMNNVVIRAIFNDSVADNEPVDSILTIEKDGLDVSSDFSYEFLTDSNRQVIEAKYNSNLLDFAGYVVSVRDDLHSQKGKVITVGTSCGDYPLSGIFNINLPNGLFKYVDLDSSSSDPVKKGLILPEGVADIGDSLSISMWVKHNSNQSHYSDQVQSSYFDNYVGGPDNRGYIFYPREDGLVFSFVVDKPAENGSGFLQLGRKYSFSDEYNFDQWNYLTVTLDSKDSEKELKFYVNGQEKDTISFSGSESIRPFESMPNIGGLNYDYGLDGQVDEFRLYNRVLSAEEINQLYIDRNTDSGKNGLVVGYHFNEYPGDLVASDFSSNGNNASLQSGASFVDLGSVSKVEDLQPPINLTNLKYNGVEMSSEEKLRAGNRFNISLDLIDNSGIGLVEKKITRFTKDPITNSYEPEDVKFYSDYRGPLIDRGSDATLENPFTYNFNFYTDINPTWLTVYELELGIFDIDSNSNTLMQTIKVLPEHCFDGEKNYDEVYIDQGGSCGTINGGSCQFDWECYGDKCINGKCVAYPKILDVSPMDGASGNWVTILGNNFGDDEGEVYFDTINSSGCSDTSVLDDESSLYWSLDDTNFGGDIFASNLDSSGIKNSSFVFGGSSSVLVGPASDILVDSENQMALSAWFKTTSQRQGTDRMYIASLKRKVNEGSTASTLFSIDFGHSEAGSVGLLTYVGDGQASGGADHEWLEDNNSGDGYNDGLWHHVVASIDGNNRKLYIDGALVSEDNLGMEVIEGNTDEFTVGAFEKTDTGVRYSFNGNIDEVYVFDRPLESSEVETLYQAGNCDTSVINDSVLANVVNQANCLDNWTNNWVIVEVPDNIDLSLGSKSSIRLVKNTSGDELMFDSTTDNFGPKPNVDGLFTKNNLQRPGLCRIDPLSAYAEDSISLFGTGFGDNEGSVWFTDQYQARINSWAESTLVSEVPDKNLKGILPVFVRVNSIDSNALPFTVINDENRDNIVPTINSISPISTTPGSFITISGTGFGESGHIYIDDNRDNLTNCVSSTNPEGKQFFVSENILKNNSFELSDSDWQDWAGANWNNTSAIFNQFGFDVLDGDYAILISSGQEDLVPQMISQTISDLNPDDIYVARISAHKRARDPELALAISTKDNDDIQYFWNFETNTWVQNTDEILQNENYVLPYELNSEWGEYSYIIDNNKGNLTFYWGVNKVGTGNPAVEVALDNAFVGLYSESEGCTELNFDFPDECPNTWKSDQIIAIVPEDLLAGDYYIALRNNYGNFTRPADVFGEILEAENRDLQPLNIYTGPVMPGICALDPEIGLAPNLTNRINIYGIGLLDNVLTERVYFWQDNSVINDKSTWLSTHNITSVYSDIDDDVNFNNIRLVDENNLQTFIPYDSSDGNSMQSGSIVVNVGDNFSNPFDYTVSDCRQADDSFDAKMLGAGYQCCVDEGPNQGNWKPSTYVCAGETREAGYMWRFGTGEIITLPRVVEFCDTANWFDVGGDSANEFYPSPTPSTLWSTGEDVCINATIALRFNTDINPDTINVNTVQVYTCDDDDGQIDCSDKVQVDPTQLDFEITGNNTLEIRSIPPATTLDQNTWYRVELSNEISAVAQQSGEITPTTYKLQDTNDCEDEDLGTAYCFEFRTGEENCELVGAGINPRFYTTHYLGKLYDPDGFEPNPFYYFVWGVANKECIVLDAGQYDWNWDSDSTYLSLENTQNETTELTAEKETLGTQVTASADVPFKQFVGYNTVELLDNVGSGGGIRIISSTDIITIDDLSFGLPGFIKEDNTVLHLDIDLYGLGDLFSLLNINSANLPEALSQLYTEKNNQDGYWQFTRGIYQNGANNFNIYVVDRIYSLDTTGIEGGERYLYIPEIFSQPIKLSGFNLGNRQNLNFYIEKSGSDYKLYIGEDNYNNKISIANSTNDFGVIFVPDTDSLLGGGYYAEDIIKFLGGNINKFELYSQIDVVENKTITAFNTTTISILPPTVVDYAPNCVEACINTSVWAKFDRLMVEDTFTDNMILEKCSDGVLCETTEDAGVDYGVNLNNSEENKIWLDLDRGEYLEPNTWYKVIVKGGIDGVRALARLADDQLGRPMVDDFVWKFRTKDDASPCEINSIDVIPADYSAYVVGDQKKYLLRAYSLPDNCSSMGQEVNTWNYSWGWGANPDRVATTTNFSFADEFNPICNLDCLLRGSDYSRDYEVSLCGDGVVSAGEDCDIADEDTQQGCNENCLRSGNLTNTCGDGVVNTNYGEECDTGIVDQENYCSENCLNIGSQKLENSAGNLGESLCGDGVVSAGEDCDIADENTSDGCGSNCLHLGTKLSQNWCYENDGPVGPCEENYSKCGNGVVETDEECEATTFTLKLKDTTEISLAGTAEENGYKYCSQNCLLQNACDLDVSSQLICDSEDEGCRNDCTLSGSSVTYSEASICGDGDIGLGEYGDCELDYIPEGDRIGNPIQRVTAVGLGDMVDGDDLADGEDPYQFANITATVLKYYDDVLDSYVDLEPNAKISGSGDYYLRCGFSEYNTNSAPYNDCPVDGSGFAVGVADNSCCYPRAEMTNQYPVDGAGITGEVVCPNTLIEIDFSSTIKKSSLENNIIIAEGFTDSNYSCEDNGFVDVSSLVTSTYLSYGSEGQQVPDSLFGKIWYYIKSFFARLFGGDVFATKTALTSVPVWCDLDLDFDTHVENDRDNSTGILSVNLNEMLPTDSFIAVFMRGGNNGITDVRGVGIQSSLSGANNLNDSFVFQTSNTICKIDNVFVEPASYLFDRPFVTSTFHIVTINENSQKIVGIPGVYDWSIDWQPQGNEIVNIPQPGYEPDYTESTDFTIIGCNDLEGSVVAVANAEITADISNENNQSDKIFSGIANLEVNFCESPWPPRADDGTWSPYIDDEFNFSMSYCADSGQSANTGDDLPYLEGLDLTDQINEVHTTTSVFTTDGNLPTSGTVKLWYNFGVPDSDEYNLVDYEITSEEVYPYVSCDSIDKVGGFLSCADVIKTYIDQMEVGSPYGGGILAYILEEGDFGYDPNKMIGLIAAENDYESAVKWGCSEQLMNVFNTELLAGEDNTQIINSGCSDSNIAAKVALNYSDSNGYYHDWFLPSKDELEKMIENKDLIGNFTEGGIYWSSSELDDTQAYVKQSVGNTTPGRDKNHSSYVRPVRYVELFDCSDPDFAIAGLESTNSEEIYKIKDFENLNVWSSTKYVPQFGFTYPFVREVYNEGNGKTYFNFYNCDIGDTVGYEEVEVTSTNTAKMASLSEDTLKRILFFNDKNDDVVGLQIFSNPEGLSASDWFAKKFEDSANLQTVSLDGYIGVTDGRTYYVQALNQTENNIYTNIYSFSINQGAGQNTLQVFEKILNSIKFNTNISDHKKCFSDNVNFNSPYDPLLSVDNIENNMHSITSFDCNTDFDCRDPFGVAIDGTNGVCSDAKTKMFRDLDRLPVVASLQNIAKNLEDKEFKSGTYLPGYTVSKWPSWSNFQYQDLINDWVGCDIDNENIDSQTCWNSASSTYNCPQYSRVFEYKYVSSTNSYNLHGPLEYFPLNSPVVANYAIDISKYSTEPYCQAEESYSPFGEKCGDGVIQGGEECEPIGKKITTNYGVTNIIEADGCLNNYKNENWDNSCMTDADCIFELSNLAGDTKYYTDSDSICTFTTDDDEKIRILDRGWYDSLNSDTRVAYLIGCSDKDYCLQNQNYIDRIYNGSDGSIAYNYNNPILANDISDWLSANEDKIDCTPISELISEEYTIDNVGCGFTGDLVYGSCNDLGDDYESYQVCSNSCQWQYGMCEEKYICGNGKVEGSENCDDGALNGTYNHCKEDCSGISDTRCGNSEIDYDDSGNRLEKCEPVDLFGNDIVVLPFDDDTGTYYERNYLRFVCNSSLENSYINISGIGGFVYNLVLAQLVEPAIEKCTVYTSRCTNDKRILCSENSDCLITPDKEVIDFSLDRDILDVRLEDGLDNFGSTAVLQGICTSTFGREYAFAREASCSWDCQDYGSYCGDGVANSDYGEQCDDANDIELDGCNNYCQKENIACKEAVKSNVEVVGSFTEVLITGDDNSPDTSYIDDCFGNADPLQICRAFGLPYDDTLIYTEIEEGVRFDFEPYFPESTRNRFLPDLDSGPSVKVVCQGEWDEVIPVENAGDDPVCGDGVVQSELGEVCDLGIKNGEKCTPAYGERCSYCSFDCGEVLTVDSNQFCGNGIVETGSVRGVAEECEIDENGNVITADGIQECVDKGSYDCNPSCQLVDNCVDCRLRDDYILTGAMPSIELINVLKPQSNNLSWPLEEKLGVRMLYGYNNERSENLIPFDLFDPFEPKNNKKYNLSYYTPVDSNFYPDYRLDSNGFYKNNPFKVNTNFVCNDNNKNYKIQISKTKWEADNNHYQDNWSGDSFEYPVNLEKTEILNTYVVSPPVREGEFRVVVRWGEEQEDIGFSAFAYNQGLALSNLQPLVTYADFLTIEGICKDAMYRTNCDDRNGIYQHMMLNKNNDNNVQAMTIDTSGMSLKYDYAVGVSVSGLENGLFSNLGDVRDLDLHVDVYEYNEDKSQNAIYKPDYTFKISKVVNPGNIDAKYWHAFSLAYDPDTGKYNVVEDNTLRVDSMGLKDSLDNNGIQNNFVEFNMGDPIEGYEFTNGIAGDLEPFPEGAVSFIMEREQTKVPELQSKIYLLKDNGFDEIDPSETGMIMSNDEGENGILGDLQSSANSMYTESLYSVDNEKYKFDYNMRDIYSIKPLLDQQYSFVLSSGEPIIILGSEGDKYVWVDSNSNGVEDDGELNYPNTLQLESYQEVNETMFFRNLLEPEDYAQIKIGLRGESGKFLVYENNFPEYVLNYNDVLNMEQDYTKWHFADFYMEDNNLFIDIKDELLP